MKIKIRSFEGSDTANLLELFHETVHHVNNADYPPEHLDVWAPGQPDLKKWKIRFKTSETLIAEIEGKIVGFGNLEHSSSTIGMLYVHKDYQRQGIATALLQALEKKLRKGESANASAEASITARPFFEKRGYHVVRENGKMLNGIEFLNFIMQKALTLKDKGEVKMKKKEKGSFRWRDLIVSKILDLTIVIAGVTIAFQLNNLKINSDRKSLETFYLQSMLVDLEKDILMAKGNLEDIKSDRKLVTDYLRQLGQPDPSPDSLGIVIVETIWFETFNGNQDTYATLLASNGFSTLGDQTIRSQITEYYKQYQSIERFDKSYAELMFRFYGYFSPYCDFAKRQIIDTTVVSKVETRNLLLITLGQLNDSVGIYAEMIQKSVGLKKRIQKAIQE